MLRHTQSAIEKGKVSEEQVDRALANLFAVQLRLGLFDGNPREGRYGKLGSNDICSSGHRKLALEAARQGIVLLKNDHKLLPLNKNHVSSLAIIGPMAHNISNMGGTYTGSNHLSSCCFKPAKFFLSFANSFNEHHFISRKTVSAKDSVHGTSEVCKEDFSCVWLL